eukprot:CAMPEP_0171267424 /NCGR_PEP_ID=MMETSP0790-20130122/59149_1 /TAXON_ID=2925 /ORGANISM="Alexandrium catenella, Strain OF101" /LENGTH=311 /DNA_ID=CAMNT_0011736155 /DNA_START=9 /DNA_END=944 /DNA_ORIENTATION=+
MDDQAAPKPPEALQVAAGDSAGEAARAELSSALKSEPAQAAALCSLVRLHVTEGQATEALPVADDALALFRDLQDAKGQGAVLGAVAGLDMPKGQPEEVLRVAKRVAAHFRELGDKEGEAYGQMSCAAAHTACNEATKAVAAASLALSLFTKVNFKEGECIAFRIASKAHLLAGDAKEAMRMAEKCRALAQSVLQDRRELEPAALVAVAEAQLAKAAELKSEENYRKADQAARRAMELYGELRDAQGQQIALYASTRATRGLQEVQEPGTAEAQAEIGAPSARYSAIKKIGVNVLEGPRSMMYQVNGGRLI